MRVSQVITVVLAMPLLSACYKPPRAYADFGVPIVGYDDIQRPSRPYRIYVSVEFQRNGLRHPAGEAEIKPIALQVLRGTGMFIHDDSGPEGKLEVVINNISNVGAARAQFLMREFVPLTGLLNTTITDQYEMSVAFTHGGLTRSVTGVKHTLYLVMGTQDLPPGAQPVSIPVAVNRIVETMLLTAVRDLQQAGTSSEVSAN